MVFVGLVQVGGAMEMKIAMTPMGNGCRYEAVALEIVETFGSIQKTLNMEVYDSSMGMH